jgi:hypothetical protein
MHRPEPKREREVKISVLVLWQNTSLPGFDSFIKGPVSDLFT